MQGRRQAPLRREPGRVTPGPSNRRAVTAAAPAWPKSLGYERYTYVALGHDGRPVGGGPVREDDLASLEKAGVTVRACRCRSRSGGRVVP
ncbi:hypothetical protein GCM10020220_060280 [Nonomuraea rubra]